MRKWLVPLLAIALLFVLPKINTRWGRRRSPLLKRINGALNALAAVLLLVYLGAFFYWLWTEVIR